MTTENGPQTKYRILFEKHDFQEGLKKKAVRGASYTVVAQTINISIQTVGTIILGRLLSPNDFGLVTMVATFSLLIQNFGVNGFTEVIIQKDDLNHQEMSKLFWINLAIMTTFTVAFIALSPLFVWFYKEPQTRNVSIALAFTILLSGLQTCHLALLMRSMKFRIISIAQILAGFLSTGISIGMAAQGYNYWALVFRRISWVMFLTLFAWMFCQWRPSFPLKKTNVRLMNIFAFRTYGNFLMDYLRRNLDKILIGKIYGKSALGLYDRSYYLATLLPSELSSALSGVAVATLSRLKNDPEKYLSYFAKSLTLLAFVAFPGSVLILLLGKEIMVFLLGPQWSKAGELLSAFGPSVGLVIIYNANFWLHISLGRADRLIKWSFVSFFTCIIAYSMGAFWGPLGVAISYSVLNYLLFLPALCYAGRPLNIKASLIISAMWQYWLAAFLAGATFYLGFHLIPPFSLFFYELSPLLKIALGSVSYLLFYLAVIIILFKGIKPFRFFFSLFKETIT